MTDYVANILRSPIPAPAGAAIKYRDPILAGIADKCRFLFDLDFSYSYPGGAYSGRAAPGNPTDNQVVHDIADRAAGRHVFNTVFEAPRTTYAGGGFDFSAVTHRPFGVQGPADAWDAMYAAPNDYFLWFGYYRLPISSDWLRVSGVAALFQSTPNTGFYVSNPDPLTVTTTTISAGNPRLAFHRQTAVGTVVTTLLTPTAAHYGKTCQVAFWRNASGIGCHMIPLDDEAASVATTGAVGAENSANYSALRPCWGASGGANNNMVTDDRDATNYRLYRGGLFDLTGVVETPQSILLADRTRVRARIAASAAGNGGTSLIFV